MDIAQCVRLMGQELSSVSVETNAVRLQFVKYPLLPSGRFTDACLIDIEHGFEVASSDGREVFLSKEGVAAFRVGASGLVRMIEQLVVEAVWSPEGNLQLRFDGGHCLSILQGDDGFEGFAVHMG